MSIEVISILVAVLVILISMFIYSLFVVEKVDLLGRVDNETLNSILQTNKAYEPSKSIFGRFYKKYLEKYFISRLDNAATLLGVNIDHIQGKIEVAGIQEKISAVEIIALKIIGIISFPIIAIPAILSKQLSYSLMALIIFMALYFLPMGKINDAIKDREKKIIYELPQFIEQLYMCIEAGSNLKMALDIISTKIGGILGEELQKALTKSEYSGSWEKELTEMSDKIDIEPLKDFINDILIAYDKGISISKILREEVKHINVVRRSKLREEKQKIQGRLFIPIMLFFVIPTLAIIMIPVMIQASSVLN